MTADVRIGCSSWTSEAWWERLYPRSLSDGERLGWYARLYPTVEVDSTFYALPRAFLSDRWRRTTPDGFLFAAKMTRDLLDRKAAIDPGKLEPFREALRPLKEKLGPILLQFPPSFRPSKDARFLEELLAALPKGPRYAVELRDPGWFSSDTLPKLTAALADRAIALAWSYLTYVDVPPEVTADFLYVRFIGDHTTVPSTVHGEVRVDRSEATRRWAERVRERMDDVERIFVFFNNHFAGFAPESVNRFREEMDLPPVAYAPPPMADRAQQRLD
jgi:uncharacterized protein YecE (DUF72 family)